MNCRMDPSRPRAERPGSDRLRPHPRQARRHARGQPDAHGAFRAVEHGAVAPRGGRRFPLRRAGLLRAGAARRFPTAASRAISASATSTPSSRPADTSKPATCPLPGVSSPGRPRPLAFPQRRLVRLLDHPPAGRAASPSRALPSAAARPATWTSSTASPGPAAWSRC